MDAGSSCRRRAPVLPMVARLIRGIFVLYHQRLFDDVYHEQDVRVHVSRFQKILD
jgi:hypothetical protein